MPQMQSSPRRVRFGAFEADLQTGELRKAGVKLKFTGQPFQVLAILLEHSGEVVTREELQRRLWPDTFVDVERNLNTAINKIREVLGDSAESPRFLETLPRKGYRFIAPVQQEVPAANQEPAEKPFDRTLHLSRYWVFIAIAVLLAIAGLLYRRPFIPNQHQFRRLTRLTFDSGLQATPTLSPDGRYVAFSSNRAGNSDLWVQQTDGSGTPIRVTDGMGPNWEPEWSPDGRYLAYRSEVDGGGLFIAPAFGGAGMQRRVTTFGHFPHWSPDGTKLLFQSRHFGLGSRIFLVDVRDGSEPREILSSVTSKADILSATWHPDGKRVSLWEWDFLPSPIPTFWTASIEPSGAVVKTVASPEVLKLAEGEAGASFGGWADSDSRFCWDHSGRNVYFERMFRGARNIWRMEVDPQTLKAVNLERITTGTELASDFALSADDKRLVFTSKEETVREWIFRLNNLGDGLRSDAQPITPAGMEAWEGDLSPNKASLAFSCKRAGQWDLCEEPMPSGQTDVIASDDSFIRDEPHWSRDGARLAYVRLKKSTGEVQVVTWDAVTRHENIVTDLQHRIMFVYDWSPNGDWLVVSAENPDNGQTEIWKFRAAGVLKADDAQKIVAPGPGADLFQGHFSPDGRWIAFEGITPSAQGDHSAIYVAPSTGGPRIRITDGQTWQDKPRWSSDGKKIFFIAEHNGYLNVFSVPFDPVHGRPSGEIRQVTDFKSPEFAIAEVIPSIGFSIVGDELMLTMAQRSGGVWLLDSAE
jgi:Tol biopolymer transport system component/DNA-binding winged helix-turn-helix (wHTH) protein